MALTGTPFPKVYLGNKINKEFITIPSETTSIKMSMVPASVRYLGYCRIQSDSERTLAVNNEISSEDPDWHSLFEFLFGRIIVELNAGEICYSVAGILRLDIRRPSPETLSWPELRARLVCLRRRATRDDLRPYTLQYPRRYLLLYTFDSRQFALITSEPQSLRDVKSKLEQEKFLDLPQILDEIEKGLLISKDKQRIVRQALSQELSQISKQTLFDAGFLSEEISSPETAFQNLESFHEKDISPPLSPTFSTIERKLAPI